jgi:DNA repair protein RadA/Sms
MAKAPPRFVCAECAAVTSKWAGKCETCGAWNSITQEDTPVAWALAKGAAGRRIQFTGLSGTAEPPPRIASGIAELDRVLGGGFVPGSAVLLAGDPGIGKSTLLLQAATALGRSGRRVVYVSGEESVDQIRLRGRRLDVAQAKLELAATINLRDILATLQAEPDIALVVIDSIQTMWLDNIESSPGSVTQVRAAAFELIRLAKDRNFAVVLVGHVTKEGAIAGPRVLEHMVDAVLYFEGDRGHQFRILRGVKNRFGATDEIGVFEMTETGLAEVANPSALFLAERRGNVAGNAVFAGLEGTRPVLVEVQCLLSPNTAGTPRRSVVGWDSGRLGMLLAVLDTRCGLRLGGSDVYLNVAGGLRIGEPAADLAVAAALASAATETPAQADMVFFGEVGLSGEVRQVAQAEARLKEAQKLGFAAACMPRRVARGNRKLAAPEGIQLVEIGHLGDLVARFSGKPASRGDKGGGIGGPAGDIRPSS